jgi:hypothetical protein
MIWVAGRSPTLVSQNLKATTLTYLAILLNGELAFTAAVPGIKLGINYSRVILHHQSNFLVSHVHR